MVVDVYYPLEVLPIDNFTYVVVNLVQGRHASTLEWERHSIWQYSPAIWSGMWHWLSCSNSYSRVHLCTGCISTLLSECEKRILYGLGTFSCCRSRKSSLAFLGSLTDGRKECLHLLTTIDLPCTLDSCLKNLCSFSDFLLSVSAIFRNNFCFF